MRSGFMVPILAAAFVAAGGLAAAQSLDNNGRYLPEPAQDTPAKPEASKTDAKHAEATKPKKSAAKPAERKTAVETPQQKSADKKAADTDKHPEAKPAVDKEPAKTNTSKEAKKATGPDIEKAADAKSASADPLADVPVSQRAAVRAALLWAAGEDAFRSGDQVAAAIEAFRKRNKSSASGPLTAQERETLLAAARTRDDEFGWTVVTDPATGIRLGLPSKMVPRAALADQGTRWSARHGEIQVETFRFKTDEPLAAVFARMKSEPANRKVEYSAIRSDNFIISGMQGLRKFSVRAYSRGGEVRGFTMQFDQAMEGIVAPVMVAMASAFAPFPDRVAPIAALTRNVEYGTGIIVSAAGHIVTDRKLADGCQVVVVPGMGNAEPVANDAEHGLALLRVYGRRNLKPAVFAPSAPESGDLTLIGVPDPHIQNGNDKSAEMKARLTGPAAIELKEPLPVAGFSGAAALDAQGRLAGMMETRSALPGGMQLASVNADAAIPPVRLVPAAAIRGFLTAHRVKPAQAGAANARNAVVRVICVRQ